MYLHRPDPVSRRFLTLVVMLLLVVLIATFSFAVRLPRWIEAEIILGGWWLAWVGILASLLYRGHEVEDDSEVSYGGRFSQNVGEVASSALDVVSLGCVEGCLPMILALGLVLVLGLLVEFALPALGFLLFISIGGMFARAVNDTHKCKGRLWRSLVWGGLWATLYIGPLLAIVPWLPAVFPKFG